MADTLGSRLKQMKWRFAEARMQKEWNELNALATAVNTTQLGAGVAISTLDYVTNCTPDVAPKGNPDDDGTTAASNAHPRGIRAGGGYQSANAPSGGFTV